MSVGHWIERQGAPLHTRKVNGGGDKSPGRHGHVVMESILGG